MHGSNRGLNGWTQSAAGRLGVGLIAVVLSAGAGTGTEPAADDVPPVQQDVTWPAALDDVTPRPVMSRPEAAAKRGAAHAQRDPALLPAAYQPPPPPRPGVVAEPLGTNDDDAPKKRPPIKIGVSGLVAMHTDDLDIRQALEVLSRQATLNILVSPGVQGRITVNMDGVTVDQALEAILRLGNLSSSREGNLIYVFAPEEILTQSDRGQFVTRVYHLNYIRAHDLEQMLTPFISDAGKLTVTPPSTEGIAGSTNLLGGFGAFGGAGARPAAAAEAAPAVVAAGPAAAAREVAVAAAAAAAAGRSRAATRWPAATSSLCKTSNTTCATSMKSLKNWIFNRFKSWSRRSS